jgi:sulfate transport system substrate-binding protein
MKRLIATTLACSLFVASTAQAANVTLLNVSYDPTRELYKDINGAFAADWKKKTGDDVTINMSHNGSGAQARAVIDGLDADVVTLALAADIDAISDKAKLLPKDWQKRLPQGSTPYTSTVVFLVRKGNPWKVKDWPDLVKPGIHVVTPNPKTSGGARWAYLAAWAYAEKAPGGNAEKAKAFVANLYKHVPVLDTGARGATTTFAQRGIGDVLLSWENEAHLALAESGGADKYQIVYPSNSILAEPPVALVDKNVDRHKTRKVVEAYLQFLYTPQAQEIEAKDYYRARDQAVMKAHASQFPNIPLYTIDDVFGGWTKAQQVHFSDGGIFDQIYKPGQ